MDFFAHLQDFGVTEKEITEEKKRLSQQFKTPASDRDVIWSLLNKLILQAKDYHTLKMIYYTMALFVAEEGKNHIRELTQARKYELLAYKNSSLVTKVSIITAGQNSCKACQLLEKKQFTIEEALQTMPLPCKTCETQLFENSKGFCRCLYAPAVS